MNAAMYPTWYGYVMWDGTELVAVWETDEQRPARIRPKYIRSRRGHICWLDQDGKKCHVPWQLV